MALPVLHADLSDDDLDAIVEKATTASAFLKAISHEGRLMILCHLHALTCQSPRMPITPNANLTAG